MTVTQRQIISTGCTHWIANHYAVQQSTGLAVGPLAVLNVYYLYFFTRSTVSHVFLQLQHCHCCPIYQHITSYTISYAFKNVDFLSVIMVFVVVTT